MSQSSAIQAVAQNSFASLMARNWGPSAVPKCKTIKNLTTGTNTFTVFSASGGPGVITSIFQYHNYGGASVSEQNAYNGVLSFYVDGEATPSLSYEVGSPLAWGINNLAKQPGLWSANMSSAVYNVGTQGTARNSVYHNHYLPVPWHENILVTFTPVQSGAAGTNFDIHYVTGVYFPFKLCSSSLTYNQSVGVVGNAQYNQDGISGSSAVQFLNVQNASGYIVYHSLGVATNDGSNVAFLEQNIGVYIDKPSSSSLTQAVHSLTTVGPNSSFDSSGTEDYFKKGWYGITAGNQGSCPIGPNGASGATALGYITHWTLDIVELDGGWRFNTSAIMQWETGPRGIDINNTVNNTGFTPFWCVFYYRDYI